jgi:RNA polymerase sigma-70 factor, ECF subfamily
VEGDRELVERLRGGDQEAFMVLARRYHATLAGVAATYLPSRAAAEAVVLDTWLGMLGGLDDYGGQVPFKSWLFGILVHRARSAGDSGRRRVPAAGYAAGPGRFRADGSWVLPPAPWPEDAGERLCGPPARPAIQAAIDALPPGPRRVVLLRDVAGLPGPEVSELLAISDASRRALLQHGRSRIRQALEQQVREELR